VNGYALMSRVATRLNIRNNGWSGRPHHGSVFLSISRALAGKRYGTGVSGRAQDDPLVDVYG
jgi:hypothetical protein